MEKSKQLANLCMGKALVDSFPNPFMQVYSGSASSFSPSFEIVIRLVESTT